MELMPNFQLHRPSDAAEAANLRAETPEALFVAGGTDMLVNVRRGIEQPENLIDLTAIEDLRQVTDDDDGLHIGSGLSLKELGALDAALRDYPAVAQAAQAVAGPTHQQYGTLGGNLCLDTRCLFYNQSEWWRKSNDYCLKKFGDVCHVAPGGKRCFAAFSGDVAPALLVYDAEIDLVGPKGTRRIPLAELYKNDGMDHLAKDPAEIVTCVHLPKARAGIPSAYEKARIRGSIDFPLAGAAVSVKMDGATVGELRVAVTAVNPYPHLIKNTDKFTGKPLDDDALDELREMVRSQSKPMRTTTVKPWYRRRVTGAIARRLTAQLAAT